ARELYFDLQFPAEAVLVLDEDDLKKWKIPELGLPNNPIEKAQQQLALHRRGRQPIGQYGILPKSFLSVPPVDFSRLSITRSPRVDGNKLTIWLEDLMHTRRTTFDEAFIVPLQLGSFEAHGTLISEELASSQNFDFTLLFMPRRAADVASLLVVR